MEQALHARHRVNAVPGPVPFERRMQGMPHMRRASAAGSEGYTSVGLTGPRGRPRGEPTPRGTLYAVIERDAARWWCVGYERWEVRPSRLYEVGADRWGAWCSCPATGSCKHIRMVNDRRRRPGLWYDPVSDTWRKEDLV
jgi:hypothetical protein